jgi:hypothetical protein
LRGRLLPDRPVIMANLGWPEPAAGALERVRAAVADGAGIVDIGPGDTAAVEAIHAASPQVIICADVPGADLTREPAIAARAGAALVAGAALPPRHGAAVTEATPAEAPALIAAGRAVLADADAGELASTIAVAAVLAWLGVRIVRTRHVAAVRQALEMVESIRGTRPPSWARRGLA